jgi:ABC-type amino acid transport substrate-binding protein
LLVALAIAIVPMVSAQPNDADAETLRVCAFSNPPFFFQEDEEYGGFEHDILESFAKDQGLELEISLRQRRQDGERRAGNLLSLEGCDVLAFTLTRTPEREQQADFSVPYFQVIVTLVEPHGQQSTSLQELSGKRVTTFEGTVPHSILSQNPEIELVIANGREELFGLVAEGKADATAWDSWVVAMELENYPQLRITAALSEVQYLAFCLHKDSPLTAKLDDHIRKLQKSGVFKTMLEEHFGKENAELIAGALIK